MVQFTVTNLEDTGAGSLRQAIEDANNQPGKDEIVFEDSLSGGEINLAGDEGLIINDSVSIVGLGAEQLTISNSIINTARINNVDTFLIDDSTENVIEVEISQLGLVDNGFITGDGSSTRSPAITNREKLIVRNSVISTSEELVVDLPGNISRSELAGSGIVVSGGENDAELTLIDSTIRDRTIGIENGGIIFGSRLEGENDAKTEVKNSTISGNTESGIANIEGGIVNISNSTISGNGDRYSLAGGIYSDSGIVNISNSTISDNYNSFGGGGIEFGARYDDDGNLIAAEVTITSSIVAGNRVSEFANPEEIDLRVARPEGTFTSGGNNLIGFGGNTGFIDGVNGDLVGTADNPIDPRLTPLQDNGGNTQTQALLSNSPAIDAGSNPDDLEFDQRGTGFARAARGNIDIGAVELQDRNNLVSIIATTPVALEGDSNGVFTLSRGEQTSQDLVISLEIDPNSTVKLDDYNLAGNDLNIAGERVTLTIPDGESSTELIVTALEDTAAEEAETLVIRVDTSEEYNIDGNNALATVTIAENDFGQDTVVTNTNDRGTGSLRQAIANANLLEGTQTITFDPSLQGETITLTSGELTITDSVNIEGLENRDITISGNDSSRAFRVNDGNEENQIEVNISKVTITDSKVVETEDRAYSGIFYSGSGISSRENLTITDSTVNNSADNGLFNYYGNLTINNSTITGNSNNGVITQYGSLTINDSSIDNNNYGVSNLSGALEIKNSSITGNRTGINSSGNDVSFLLEQSIVSGNRYRGIENDSSFGSAAINNSTITNTNSTSEFYDGIGIYNTGPMTINDSTITNNQGGGIENGEDYDGVLEINNTVISGNSSDTGGGIYNQGSVSITNSTISDNSAIRGGGITNVNGSSYYNTNLNIVDSIISNNRANGSSNFGGFGGYGGGINNEALANISNSTISGNFADRGGGGGVTNREISFSFSEETAKLTITNSTISGNSTDANGGGIQNYLGDLEISNSTISDNYSDRGSGIYNSFDGRPYTSNATITSTIIAGNSNNQDVAGGSEFTSNGNNLIGNGDGAEGFTDGVNGDIVGTTGNAIAPLLGTLQDNGGATQTIALLTGSPAIDTGSNPHNLATDQRGEGFPRTLDGDGDGVAVTDIGAFEAVGSGNPNPPDGGEGNGNDGELIIGTNGKDSLVGGKENDTIDGGENNDTLFGGGGNDELFGGQGKDSLVGNNGNDTLKGGNGFDSLNGSAGDDELCGDSGGDFLVGNSGNDFIDGGNGSDTLVGGLGKDSFVIRQQKGVDNIIDYIDGIDKLVLADGLTFGQLNIVERNNSTEIRLAENNRLLTKVSSISAEVIDESDFVMS